MFMVCGKSSKKWVAIMAKVRRQYPRYSLKRRKKIVYAIISRSKK